MCCSCVDYLLTALTIITSTHTNYFDRVVKERGTEAPFSRPIIRIRFSLSTPCRRFVLLPCFRVELLNPEEAGHYNLLGELVNNTVLTLFKLPNPSKAPAPEELRIIQALANPSRPI